MSRAPFYVRNPDIAVVTRRESCLFVRVGRDPLLMSPVDADAVAALMARLVTVTDADSLFAEVDDALVEFLVAEEVLLSGKADELSARLPQPPTPPEEKLCRNLVFGLTGAIGSVQVTPYLSVLARYFCDQLDVVLTAAATELLQPAYFEYLGYRAWTDAFACRGSIRVPHIELARRADMVVVMPASAHTIHKIAHGACSDLLSLTIAATAAPVVIVPAMNRAMYENPAILRNIEQLRADGYYVVVPRSGLEVSDGAAAQPALGGVGIPVRHLELALVSIATAHRDGDMA